MTVNGQNAELKENWVAKPSPSITHSLCSVSPSPSSVFTAAALIFPSGHFRALVKDETEALSFVGEKGGGNVW